MSTSVLNSSGRNGFALGLSLGLVLVCGIFLAWPDLATVARPEAIAAVPIASPAPVAMGASGARPDSMEAAMLALKTRLATQGGPDDQWQLLAQSYDFLGRSEEAQLAREHKTSPAGDLRDAISASTMLLSVPRRSTGKAPAMQAAPGAAAAILASAEGHRRKREFKEACAAYAEAARLGAMTADSWADYADAQASLAGRLDGEPEKAIANALQLDPQHPKALWLKASLAHEQHRYKEALATWRQLLAVVPPGSSDARIVSANIAEATRLATG
jgi:cytochrome c-type biogenesis protein CcmH/NrfG